MLGLVAVAVLPAAIEVTRLSKRFSLLDAAYAVPVAFVLGAVAIVLGRRARSGLQWAVLRRPGYSAARVGIVLGVAAICLALMGGLSIGLYELNLALQD